MDPPRTRRSECRAVTPPAAVERRLFLLQFGRREKREVPVGEARRLRSAASNERAVRGATRVETVVRCVTRLYGFRNSRTCTVSVGRPFVF